MLRARVVIRAILLFNLQRNNVARQVVQKCCPYYLTFTEKRDRKCSTWRMRRRFGAVLHRANGRAGNEAQEVVQSFQRDFAPSSHLPLCCPFHISLKTRCGVGTGSCGQFRRRNSLLILISSCFYSKMATSLSGHLPITPVRLFNVL